jgi:hypothetical protein
MVNCHLNSKIGNLIKGKTTKSSTTFRRNKPNVKDAQMNLSSFMISKYVKVDNWLNRTNKPNSNPIKPNLSSVYCLLYSVLNKTNPNKANNLVGDSGHADAAIDLPVAMAIICNSGNF